MAAGVADPLTARYQAVCDRIAAACRRAGRAVDDVRLVAVTKGMPAEIIRAAAALGMRRFGENYIQESRAKRAHLTDLADIEWHFIGRIQRNKAAASADFALVHSLADERVAAVLDREGRRRAAAAPAGGYGGRCPAPVRVLVQVNLAGEATKEGVPPAALPMLLAALRRLAWVRVEGLMTIPPPRLPEEVRPIFAALRELRDRQEAATELRELSMGMSADFEAAIEEGATLVRIGTAIFGPRKEAT
jgi:pyridoxal phosphate enzyme (YggS family)